MINKETFKKVIDCIIKHREKEKNFVIALEELSPGNYCDCFLYSEFEDILVKLLQEIFDDKDDLIGLWIYEYNFGEKSVLKTADELYDKLIMGDTKNEKV